MERIPTIQVKENTTCLDDLSAYLDGDLSPTEELSLEAHIAQCPGCHSELNQQKAFLRMLDGSMTDDLPVIDSEKLTRAIVVNAESSVSGLRNQKERSIAAIIVVAVLGAAALSIMIVGGGFSGSSPLDGSAGIASAIGHLTYNFGLSLTVIVRAMTADLTIRRLVIGTGIIAGLGVFAFLIRRPLFLRIFRNP